MSRTAPPPTRVRLDLFPARIVDWDTGEPLADPCRVIVLDDEVRYYIDTGKLQGPMLKYQSRIEDVTGAHSTGFRIWLADGETSLYIVKSGGCGCGSRLRGFTPVSNSVLTKFEQAPLAAPPPHVKAAKKR